MRENCSLCTALSAKKQVGSNFAKRTRASARAGRRGGPRMVGDALPVLLMPVNADGDDDDEEKEEEEGGGWRPKTISWVFEN